MKRGQSSTPQRSQEFLSPGHRQVPMAPTVNPTLLGSAGRHYEPGREPCRTLVSLPGEKARCQPRSCGRASPPTPPILTASSVVARLTARLSPLRLMANSSLAAQDPYTAWLKRYNVSADEDLDPTGPLTEDQLLGRDSGDSDDEGLYNIAHCPDPNEFTNYWKPPVPNMTMGSHLENEVRATPPIPPLRCAPSFCHTSTPCISSA